MNDDAIGRALASRSPRLEPSPGFAAAVMEAVLREAAAPPPIPFPWRRAVPGLLGASCAVAWAFADLGWPSAAPSATGSMIPAVELASTAGVLAAILAGSLVAAVVATLSMELVSLREA